MRGFHTLDESFAFSPFRRGSGFVKGFYIGAAASYDWTSSLWTNSNVASNTSVHSSPDVWDGAGDHNRALNTVNYKLNMVPFLDTSGANASLKIASCGHTGDAADDFNECDTGAQATSGNNHLVCISSTGIEFSGGNLVDGDHVVKWQFKHDAKTDTFFSLTAVMWCASNVIEARTKWISNTSSYQAYSSTADAKSSGTLYWKATWDPNTNTWTVDTSDDDWQGSNNGNVSISTSGGTLSKKTTQFDINGSDPSDGRMWEITVG